ncbi:acetyl-CoA carboxylase carboxyltransferase subunit alpha/beta [Streptomyces sp. NPDC026673]|uniref:acetyl-CoA carboxylase carboxyltransferase subunit alpha/beta n=1 Tax=Streptomyces sp. NPDC026673 TaxID=3155724 RepID=UPI0033C2A849
MATAEPDWVRCERCAALVYGKRYARALRVCPECGAHGRLTARQRLDLLLDPGSCKPLAAERGERPAEHDPLDFTDTRPYAERLREARAATGLDEAVVCVRGTIEELPVVVAAMDFRFLGGSLGLGVGSQITRAARASLRRRVPLLLVTASGGARMQEGALSLMQMARTAQALTELDEAGVLVVSVVTDPTYGGVAASYATLADVILAEPGARLGFAGPRVIQQTTGERLPEGFQTAEFLFAHGLIDDVVPRAALRPTVARLLRLRSGGGAAAGRGPGVGAGASRPSAERPRPATVPRGPAVPIVRTADELPERDAWETVRLARHPLRPTAADYAAHLLQDFHELHGDRLAADCPAVIGGPGLLHGSPVMLIGHHKGGPGLEERRRRHFGMATPAGYRKAARLMRTAAKLGMPVVTLIDTPGANPGPEAETGGQALAIAENLRLMARLPVPVVAVITGEGGSGGALAFAVADRVLVSANGIYSVISPEGCAAILWKDAAAAPAAAAALRLHARDLLRLGIVDGVVPEPPDGAHGDHAHAAALVGGALSAALDELRPWAPDRLLAERRDRFHRFGRLEEEAAP